MNDIHRTSPVANAYLQVHIVDACRHDKEVKDVVLAFLTLEMLQEFRGQVRAAMEQGTVEPEGKFTVHRFLEMIKVEEERVREWTEKLVVPSFFPPYLDGKEIYQRIYGTKVPEGQEGSHE